MAAHHKLLLCMYLKGFALGRRPPCNNGALALLSCLLACYLAGLALAGLPLAWLGFFVYRARVGTIPVKIQQVTFPRA